MNMSNTNASENPRVHWIVYHRTPTARRSASMTKMPPFADSLFNSAVDLSKTFLAAADASCDESCHARFKADASRRTPGRRYCWNSLGVISLNEIFVVKLTAASFPDLHFQEKVSSALVVLPLHR